MVKVGSTDMGTGPDFRVKPYKPEPSSGYKYTGYKPNHNRDQLRNTDAYNPSGFEPSEQKYDYQQYKPSQVGMYGDKTRDRKFRPHPAPQQMKPRVIKPRRTFDSYSAPKGPDIRPHTDAGPEYKVNRYQATPYIPSTAVRPRDMGGDTLKARPSYMDKSRGETVYSGPSSYRLNEDNYAGMNHWKHGFVDDPLSTTKTEKPAPDRYKVKEKPIVKETPQEVKHEAMAALVPAPIMIPKSPLPPVKPGPKTFKTTATQHMAPDVKSIPTQTANAAHTKSMSVQTENHVSTHDPVILPVGMAGKSKKSKTAATQCSETQRKVVARGTQCNTTTHPTPVVPVVLPVKQQPDYVTRKSPEQVRHTPVMQASHQRRSPPPVVPIIAVASQRRSPSPVVHRQATPTESSRPAHLTSPVHDTRAQPAPMVFVSKTPPRPKQSSQQKTPQANGSPKPKQQSSQPKSAADSRWTPSPEQRIAPAPIPARAVSPKAVTSQKAPVYSEAQPVPVSKTTRETIQQSKAPKNVFVPPRMKTPPPKPAAQYSKSRLPPEVTAHIEAYDSAHGM